MARQVSFAVRVLDKDETALCDGPDLSVTSFVFQRTIKPDGQHTFGHCVSIDLIEMRLAIFRRIYPRAFHGPLSNEGLTRPCVFSAYEPSTRVFAMLRLSIMSP